MAEHDLRATLSSFLTRRAEQHVSHAVSESSERAARLAAARGASEKAEESCAALLVLHGFPRSFPKVLDPQPQDHVATASGGLYPPSENPLQAAIAAIVTTFFAHSRLREHQTGIAAIDVQVEQYNLRRETASYVESQLQLHSSQPQLLSSIGVFFHTCPDKPAYALFTAMQAVMRDEVPAENLRETLVQTAQVIPHPSLTRYVLNRISAIPGMIDLVTALAWIYARARNAPDITALMTSLEALEFVQTILPPQTVSTDMQMLTTAFALPSPAALAFSGHNTIQNVQHLYNLNGVKLDVTAKFLPKTSKADNNLPSEDTLLFDVHGETALAIICDGVSQSVMGYHAAQQLTHAFHRIWMTLGDMPSSIDEYWQRLLVPALSIASHTTEACVAQDLLLQTGFLRSINQESYEHTGSQAIFAVVIMTPAQIVCIWMGNTRVICNTPTPLATLACRARTAPEERFFTAGDVDFTDDKHRFSSQARVTPEYRGMRNTAFVHILDSTHADALRVIIHSDALEPYAAQISSTPHESPLPLTFLNIRESAKRDDTSLLDIVMNREPRLPGGAI